MAKRKAVPPPLIPSDNGGPFDRFTEFTRRVLAVPKAEIDARAAAERDDAQSAKLRSS